MNPSLTAAAKTSLKVGDQAWIALALLHREQPTRDDFSVQEITAKAESLFGKLQPGVVQHIISHGVAQNAPTPVRLRLFTATSRGRRRLFRLGDTENKLRKGRTHPRREDIPDRFQPLIDWYEQEFSSADKQGLKGSCPSSAPAAFMTLVGLIPAYDLGMMQQAIEQDCERIEDPQNGKGAA